MVASLVVMPNGDLIAGGNFTIAGGVAANRVARWNGTSWSAIGSGFPGGGNQFVTSLAVLPNGDLVAGGTFSTRYGAPADYLARWNGTTWSSLGLELASSTLIKISSLAVSPNGDLFAAGSFARANGVQANSIARWNGTDWHTLGTGLTNVDSVVVTSLAVLPNGDLVAGGAFTAAGGVAAANIARWDGESWSALDYGMERTIGASVKALKVLPDGDLVAGGGFTIAGGVAAENIACLRGGHWFALGSGMNAGVLSMSASPDGDLIAGGSFIAAGGIAVNRIAGWNGTAWYALGAGMNDPVLALAGLPDGDLVAGGTFTLAGGVAANYVARWNGAAWSPLGSGLNGRVQALVVLPSGDLIAGGAFTAAGEAAANGIARWNGAAWSALGSGFEGEVSSLAVLRNGDLVAGGYFTIDGGPRAARVASWNGESWSMLGSGDYGVIQALTVAANGDLIVGGTFSNMGGVYARSIARWNGTAWSPLGGGMYQRVLALTLLPNGDLIAGGLFSIEGGMAMNGIARWNGAAWSTIGSGVEGGGSQNGVYSLAVLPDGNLAVGGHFFLAGGNSSAYFARYTLGTLPPSIVSSPRSTTTCHAAPASFTVEATGTGPFTYRWRQDSTPIDPIANPSAATATLTIDNPQAVDVGDYDCIISNECGSATTPPAHLTLCIIDFNCDGGVDGLDVESFFRLWESGDPGADTNADGAVDNADVEFFFAHWESGC